MWTFLTTPPPIFLPQINADLYHKDTPIRSIPPYGAGKGHREINVLVGWSVSELVGRGKIYLALCRSDIPVAIFVGTRYTLSFRMSLRTPLPARLQ